MTLLKRINIISYMLVIGILPKTKEGLIKFIYQQHEKYVEQLTEFKNKFILMQEKYLTLKDKYFGTKSEKFQEEDDGQLLLFDETELGENELNQPEIILEKVIVRQRKKGKKTGKKILPDDIPRKPVIHDLSDEEKQCSCCRKERPFIGDIVTEELDLIPAKLIVLQHIQKKYGPCKCKESKDKFIPEIITAKKPPRLMPGSLFSVGLIAHIMTGKFLDSLPFYRQEQMLKRLGITINRTTMCNWQTTVGRKCQVLIDMLWEKALSGSFIQMDETSCQVLREPGRSPEQKSYMWVTIGYAQKMKPIILYHYHQTRREDIPLVLLTNFKGYLQTDGYAGYNKTGKIKGIIHLCCLAHIRRYFYEAWKLSKKKNEFSSRILNYIKRIYRIEKKLRKQKLSTDEFTSIRKKKVQPILNIIKEKLMGHKMIVTPKSKLGTAINYALKEWDKLEHYPEKWYLTPDNNYCERMIKPYVIGRKNWYFNVTPTGAHSSAAIFSLIQTAKENGLNPYRYLKTVFTRLPLISGEDEIRKLLPTEITEAELLE